MGFDQHVVIANLPAALPQVTNQFFARLQLGWRRLAVVEVADQANPERDIVQVVAMHMASVNLPAPAVAHFDLAVTRRCPVANDEMIGQAVLHVTNVPVVIIEDARVALARSAVVHHHELPLRTSTIRRRAIDLRPHRPRQVTVAGSAPASFAALAPVEKAVPKALTLFGASLFDGQLRRLFRSPIGRAGHQAHGRGSGYGNGYCPGQRSRRSRRRCLRGSGRGPGLFLRGFFILSRRHFRFCCSLLLGRRRFFVRPLLLSFRRRLLLV